MGNDLYGLAQIVAAAFLFQHCRIDPTGTDRIGVARRHTGKPFVMAQIQIGLGAVIRDKDLPVFKRAHRARIDIEIGVKFAQTHRKTAGLQQGTKGGRGQALAKRRDHTTGDKNKARHERISPREMRIVVQFKTRLGHVSRDLRANRFGARLQQDRNIMRSKNSKTQNLEWFSLRAGVASHCLRQSKEATGHRPKARCLPALAGFVRCPGDPEPSRWRISVRR